MTFRILIPLALLATFLPKVYALELTPEEKALIDRIDLDHALRQTKRIAEEIVANRSGAGAGSAIAGSADERKLAEHVAETLSRLGLQVEKQSFPVRAYRYEEPELRLGTERFPAVTLHTTPGTFGVRDGKEYRIGNEEGGGVLSLSLIDVGLGSPGDYLRAGDARGKAVLIHRDDNVTGWPAVTLAEAAHQGAAAAILYGCAGDTPLPHALKQDSVQYQEAIPALSISRDHARRIKSLLGRGPVRVSIRSRVDVEDRESVNVIGRIAGRKWPEERVAFGAHVDRWFQGAQDNSVGVGMLLELARLFATAEPPDRTLLFVGWGAEEAGGKDTLADWLTGSYAFIRSRGEDVRSTALYFNLDGGGWSNRQGQLFSTPEAAPFFRRLIADLGLSDRLSVRPGLSTWVDAWCFGGIMGVTSAYTQWRKGYLGGEEAIRFLDYYHTDQDRFDEKLLANLAADLRIAALAARRMDRAPLLPYEFTATATWLKEGLLSDAARAPSVDFQAAIQAVSQLERVARERGEGIENRTRLSLRQSLYPELVYSGGFLGSIRSSSPAELVAALGQARAALDRAKIPEAREALEKISSMEAARHLSPEPYRESRRRHESMVSWNGERGQLSPLPPPETYEAYLLLKENPKGERLAEAREKINGALRKSESELRSVLTHMEEVARQAESSLGHVPLPSQQADPRWNLTAEKAREILGRVRPGKDLTPRSWPGGKRVAVGLTFDLDAELVWLEDPGRVRPGELSRGHFGPRAGLARVLDVLDRRRIPATFFIPALNVKLYPEALAAVRERKIHEIGYHGYAHEAVGTLTEAEEREATRKGLEIMQEAGIRPRVYRSPSWDFSPATLSLLQEFGFRFDSSLMADDRPYEILSGRERTGVIELPVEWALDDWPYFQLEWAVPLPGLRSPAEVFEIWKEEFEGARAAGGAFILTMHPQVIGRWSRLRMLEKLLSHMEASKEAWFATLSEIGDNLKQIP